MQPHIPVIDRRHQTEGRFTRDRLRTCGEGLLGKALRYHGYAYAATPAQCLGCPQKKLALLRPIAGCLYGRKRTIKPVWQKRTIS